MDFFSGEKKHELGRKKRIQIVMSLSRRLTRSSNNGKKMEPWRDGGERKNLHWILEEEGVIVRRKTGEEHFERKGEGGCGLRGAPS